MVVLGGAGYSIFPAAALAYLGAGAGVGGDGEAAFVEVLARLEAGEPMDDIPGVHLPGGDAKTRFLSRTSASLRAWPMTCGPA